MNASVVSAPLQRPGAFLVAGPRFDLGVERLVDGDDEVGVVPDRRLENMAILGVDEIEIVDLDRFAGIPTAFDESAHGFEALGDASCLVGMAVERVAPGLVDDWGEAMTDRMMPTS